MTKPATDAFALDALLSGQQPEPVASTIEDDELRAEIRRIGNAVKRIYEEESAAAYQRYLDTRPTPTDG